MANICWVLLLSCLTHAGLSQTALLASHHDEQSNVTYYYPGHFLPALARRDGPAHQTECVDAVLSRESSIASSVSTFGVSRLSAACLRIGNMAALEAYTRDSVAQQLIPLGIPRIPHKPTRYTLNGRPAVVALAAASLSPQRLTTQAVYAAKACALSTPAFGRAKKENLIGSADTILCFDFTTRNPDLVSMMLSFVAQFGDDPPIPIFPGSALPKTPGSP